VSVDANSAANSAANPAADSAAAVDAHPPTDPAAPARDRGLSRRTFANVVRQLYGVEMPYEDPERRTRSDRPEESGEHAGQVDDQPSPSTDRRQPEPDNRRAAAKVPRSASGRAPSHAVRSKVGLRPPSTGRAFTTPRDRARVRPPVQQHVRPPPFAASRGSTVCRPMLSRAGFAQ
jgi:hypothetical protein